VEDHDRLIQIEAEVTGLQRALTQQQAAAGELHAALQRSADKETANVERRLNEVAGSIQKVVDQLTDMMSRKEWDSEHRVLENQLRDLQDRFETRSRQLDATIAELRLTIVPRGEVKILMDALASRLDSTATQIGELSRLLTAVRSGQEGQSQGQEEVYKRNERTRAWVFGLIAMLLSITSILVTVLILHHTPSSSPQQQQQQTTTTLSRVGP
jgi:chromosome segregation ATPase